MRRIGLRNSRPAVVAALLALGAAGCGDGRALRIAVHAGPSAALLAAADEQGLLSAQRVRAKLLRTGSAEAMRAAFVRGQADGMAGALGEVLAVLGASRYRPRVVLVTESRGDEMEVIAFDAAVIRARSLEIAGVIRAVDAARRATGSRLAAPRMADSRSIPPGLAAQRALLRPGGAVERLGARVQAARAAAMPARRPRLLLDLAAPEVLDLAERH